ncbi:MAG: DUF2769 domain-containing protein [Methanolobus sp.]|uniref:DUF2769 domain-containing protein n=1 Tax=Methanolobus sp. TaxID=1874737 RepID=UPI00273227DC|nr:DUF2769 domain-containing protein [Methanolobus sp.]MDP2216898.1 DUF2769 domain-containing protein [Methanolobus sp.]
MSEIRAKYFGVCTSYHHSKGCNCPRCPSYPGNGTFMFCAKGRSSNVQQKAGCLCTGCEIHRKFGFEGEYFCQ